MKRSISVTLDDDQLAEIDRRAIAANMSRSDYLIKMALAPDVTRAIETLRRAKQTLSAEIVRLLSCQTSEVKRSGEPDL